MDDLDDAITEMERAAKMGCVGTCIPCTAPPDRLYTDPYYDRFWAAAQDLGQPLAMHIFTSSTPNHGLGDWGRQGYTMAFAGISRSIMDIIWGGVCERFPELVFIPTEFETGWVAHFKQRLDHAAYRTPKFAVDYLTMRPSEYFDRNFWVTFEDDEAGILTRHLIGLDNLLWGNDYPHHDAIWPNSMSILDRIMDGVPDDERQKMVWDNVVELYGIDTTKLPAPA
jgi:predicted TIM-barrel fold metal-dependent hydrolase